MQPHYSRGLYGAPVYDAYFDAMEVYIRNSGSDATGAPARAIYACFQMCEALDVLESHWNRCPSTGQTFSETRKAIKALGVAELARVAVGI